MSFIGSKIFWTLVQPGNLLLILLVIAALFARLWPNLARRLLRITVILLLIVTFVPIGQWLRLPIEQRFPELTVLPEKVDGIVVLGGAVDVSSTIGRTYLELNGSAERLIVSADVARRYPEARLVYSGFKGRLIDVTEETPAIVDFYVRQGVDRKRIILEDSSRNTYENAVLSKDLADPVPNETWILITSAYHMPRAFGVFHELGWPVVAMPVDFRQPLKPEFRSYLSEIVQPSMSDRLKEVNLAVKSWIGLAAYWLIGRTPTLLPSP